LGYCWLSLRDSYLLAASVEFPEIFNPGTHVS
jgi:hypothetical protein